MLIQIPFYFGGPCYIMTANIYDGIIKTVIKTHSYI
jgi:hypothetical protein